MENSYMMARMTAIYLAQDLQKQSPEDSRDIVEMVSDTLNPDPENGRTVELRNLAQEETDFYPVETYDSDLPGGYAGKVQDFPRGPNPLD